MKKPWLILVTGLAIALIAYGGSYLAGTARSRQMCAAPHPELAWLKQEFQLPDESMARVEQIHEAYMAACLARCERIDARNEELKRLVLSTNSVNEEIERAIRDAALLRAECHQAMLDHFYQISRAMPPEQGRRYLEWIVERTFGPSHAGMTGASPAAHHGRHHH
ncbi:MAG TPA: hypothetical protein GYA07_11945 [Verrucomicrobia bacterium]|mgnify:CR=1 FL=1|nr:hypothetical protein [Verrucomicrobiota bacterium]HOB31374.1 hypothetical protein [Verrucomicrobiota bacterium]HOP98336.1 hypothetical protein [Verrucomicrobiota bacterium]HPU55764.1 hypothetical protein [Verrucomicrobiota bacterium]